MKMTTEEAFIKVLQMHAGSPSWFRFLEAVQDLFPFEHVIPTHQGRAAENILFTAIGGVGKFVPNNTHFDTTRANVEYSGAAAVDLVIPEGHDSQSRHPFNGNMDLAALDERGHGDDHGELRRVALEVVGHRQHRAVGVAHQHDLRGPVEDLRVGLGDVEAAESGGALSE